MNIPMDGGGAVGGNTETISQGSSELSAQASKLETASGVVTRNGRSADQAAGDPAAASAVSAFTAAWSEYLDGLTSHVTALARLAETGAQDLVAAGQSSKPTSGLPPILQSPLGNARFPGEAPGWHPPMLPGYVPPLSFPVTTGGR